MVHSSKTDDSKHYMITGSPINCESLSQHYCEGMTLEVGLSQKSVTIYKNFSQNITMWTAQDQLSRSRQHNCQLCSYALRQMPTITRFNVTNVIYGLTTSTLKSTALSKIMIGLAGIAHRKYRCLLRMTQDCDFSLHQSLWRPQDRHQTNVHNWSCRDWKKNER